MKKFKVMLITNIISPYRIPLFNAICEIGNFDFKVIALAEKEKNREWEINKDKIKFNYQILPGWHLFIWGKEREVPIHLNRNVLKTLWEYKPDIVITSGYDSIAYWQSFLYCKFLRKKFILWNGTTLLSVGGRTGVRRILKRIIVKNANGYIAYGTKAKEYLKHLGAKSENIYISLNTVDTNDFHNKVFQYRNSKKFHKEREKYPGVLFLYVGQLIKRKGLIQVLKALSVLQNSEVGLIVVGNGPEDERLKTFCIKNELQNVFFEGFHQQEDLPRYYALADILILPSFEEVWGLVANEALASGLYVLCSRYAGAGYDLVKEGWNGKIFDPYNVEELAMVIQKTKNEIEDIRAHRKAISEQACREFSIERSAQAFLDSITFVQTKS